MSRPDIVLSVVRGDMPLSALRPIGVSVARNGRVSNATISTVRPTLADLAAGFKKHARRPSLRKWALLILHAPFIELEPDANSPEWDAILGSIWDAAGVP